MRSWKNGMSNITRFSHPVQTVASNLWNHGNLSAVNKPNSIFFGLTYGLQINHWLYEKILRKSVWSYILYPISTAYRQKVSGWMIFWPRPFVSPENKRQRHRRRHQHKHLEMCNGHSEEGPKENDRQGFLWVKFESRRPFVKGKLQMRSYVKL